MDLTLIPAISNLRFPELCTLVARQMPLLEFIVIMTMTKALLCSPFILVSTAGSMIASFHSFSTKLGCGAYM